MDDQDPGTNEATLGEVVAAVLDQLDPDAPAPRQLRILNARTGEYVARVYQDDDTEYDGFTVAPRL